MNTEYHEAAQRLQQKLMGPPVVFDRLLQKLVVTVVQPKMGWPLEWEGIPVKYTPPGGDD